MKTPFPSSRYPNPTATLEAFGQEARPEPPALDVAAFFGLPHAKPLRKSLAKIPASDFRASAHIGEIEERKIPMPFSPPRFKKQKNGKTVEVKWLLVLCSRTVTVTVEHGTFTLTATDRGQTVKDSRNEKRRWLLPMLRTDLGRLLGIDGALAVTDALRAVMPL